jgi:DNA-directed RNA polymerase subunit alpha
MEKIGLPKISEEKIAKNQSVFTIEPLFPGYGPTIGNSLRRILLSSITGAAATSFRIEGISHEFTSVEHVKEDVIEIMMNLKNVKFLSYSDEPVVIEVSKRGPGTVVAGDFKPNSNIEIANPDQIICNLDNKADFNMEVVIEKDRGFRPVNVGTGEKKEIGQIGIDAAFSPIDRIKMAVEDTRVGQMTNFDKLVIDITTNGTVDPNYAMKEAAKILVDHFTAIISDETFNPVLTETYAKEEEEVAEAGELEGEFEETDASGEGVDSKTKIEEACFSPRTTNALLNAGVKTIAGLKRLSPLKLEEIKGLGKKGIEEIKEVTGE